MTTQSEIDKLMAMLDTYLARLRHLQVTLRGCRSDLNTR
jgi:hypothetical protein